MLPFPVDEDEEDEEPERQPDQEGNGPAPRATNAATPQPNEQDRLAAKSTMEDFTRNIQRKKERELAELQLVGGDGSSGPKQVVAGQKVGRNDPCPCGSGKKYKKCHGA